MATIFDEIKARLDLTEAEVERLRRQFRSLPGLSKAELPQPPLDCLASQSHGWVALQVQTKFLRLSREVAIGDHIDGWRVGWIGGWDKCRVVFVVMVEKCP